MPPKTPPRRKLLFAILSFVVFCLGSAATAKADEFVLTLSGPAFSGPANPTGSITVTISDVGQPANTVQITIANNTNGSIDGLYLNSIASVVGASSNCTGCSAVGSATFSFGSNAFQADGDGLYDIRIEFPTGAADRFAPGDSIVFTITATGITPGSFNAFSAPAGGHGPFRAAAHVISVGGEGGDSAWIADTAAVPEPTTLLFLGTGLSGAAAWARKRRRRQND